MTCWSALPLVFTLALAGCHTVPAGTACNGHDELCARPYDQVAFPGTHDAYSTVAGNFAAPDQTNSMSQQLADGVRVLHMEIFSYDDDTYLCHAVCVIGSQLLVDGLREVEAFTSHHPREVVTLLMESTNVTRDTIAQALDKAGLGSRLRKQTFGAPWPTLGKLIDDGDRVVAFLADQTNTGGGSYAQILDRWSWTWETPWDNESAADFARCDVDRGTQGNDLYVVDTYVEGHAIPTAADAQLVNNNPFLLDRLLRCHAATGQLPSFVMVNYYEVGDLFADVDVLNGLTAAPSVDVDAFPQPFDAGSD